MTISGEQGAHAGRRQGGENRDGVDVVLVEDAQDDVDGGQRREDQVRLGGQRVLKGLRGSLKAADEWWLGKPISRSISLNGGDCVSQGDIGGQVEGEGDRGKLALMGDGERGSRRLRSA